jgi:hypothetical protein
MALAETDLDLSASQKVMPGSVTGGVASTLRFEAAVELVFAVLVYRALGGSWWLFAVLFLLPDLSMLGYIFNSRIGATTYNVGHCYLTPAAVALAGFMLHVDLLYLLAAIWFPHIGFDRMLGYGLKYPQRFGATHLGWKVKRVRSV